MARGRPHRLWLAAGVQFTDPVGEDAVAAWVGGMSNHRINLVELRRRRGFGLIYSTCPRDGGESILFNVEVHEFGVA